MRLLKTAASDVENWVPQLVDSRGEKYAILSHRWHKNAHDEVLFTDVAIVDDGGPTDDGLRRHSNYFRNPAFNQRDLNTIPGFRKLREASNLAQSEDFAFIWVDTCCIDKSSSTELSEALNSMYRWYQESQRCYVYLQDVAARAHQPYVTAEPYSEADLRLSQW